MPATERLPIAADGNTVGDGDGIGDRGSAERLALLRALFVMSRAVDAGERLPEDAFAVVHERYQADHVKADDDLKALQLRKTILRRIWHEHFRGLLRSPAARSILAAWGRHRGQEDEAIPGTLADLFGRLGRAGIEPVSLRTIINDLDTDLDRR